MGPSADKEHVWFLDTGHPALQEALTRAGRVCHDATAMSQEELLSHAAIRDAAPIHGIVLRSRIRLDEKHSAHFPTCGGSRAAGPGSKTLTSRWLQTSASPCTAAQKATEMPWVNTPSECCCLRFTN